MESPVHRSFGQLEPCADAVGVAAGPQCNQAHRFHAKRRGHHPLLGTLESRSQCLVGHEVERAMGVMREALQASGEIVVGSDAHGSDARAAGLRMSNAIRGRHYAPGVGFSSWNRRARRPRWSLPVHTLNAGVMGRVRGRRAQAEARIGVTVRSISLAFAISATRRSWAVCRLSQERASPPK